MRGRPSRAVLNKNASSVPYNPCPPCPGHTQPALYAVKHPYASIVFYTDFSLGGIYNRKVCLFRTLQGTLAILMELSIRLKCAEHCLPGEFPRVEKSPALVASNGKARALDKAPLCPAL